MDNPQPVTQIIICLWRVSPALLVLLAMLALLDLMTPHGLAPLLALLA